MEHDLTTQADRADIEMAAHIAANSDDEIVVGCIPSAYTPVVASTTHTCANCGALIWVSIRILDALPPRGRLLCLGCVAGNTSGLN